MRITSVETKKNIGWLIAEKRVQKGMSQLDLCRKAEVTQTFLSLLEHGKRSPSREALERIASALGEEAAALEQEAGDLESDPEAKLDHLLTKLKISNNKSKLRRVVEFIETLS